MRLHDGYDILVQGDGWHAWTRPFLRYELSAFIQECRRYEGGMDFGYFLKSVADRRTTESSLGLFMSVEIAKVIIKGCRGNVGWQAKAHQNLYDGAILRRINPKLARRSCSSCQLFLYGLDGEIAKRLGKPISRDESVPPACVTGICDKGTPEKPKSLSTQNQMAFDRNEEWKAVNKWPDDAIVRRNAAIIARAEKVAESRRAK